MAGNDGKVTIQIDTNAGSAAKQFDELNKAVKRSEQEVKTAKAALDAHNASMKFLGNTSQSMKDMQGYLAISYNQSKMALADNRLELEKFKQAQQGSETGYKALKTASDTLRDSLRNLALEGKQNTQEFQKLKQELNNTEQQLKKADSAVDGFSLAGIKLGTALKGIGWAAVAKGVYDIGKSALTTAKSFEQLNVAFGVLAGQKAGEKLVKDLVGLANTTPLTIEGLSNTARLLLAYGEAAENVIPDLKLLGDISGGNQEIMNRLALAYGQIGTEGKLLGLDLRQLTQLGFNPLAVISEKTGKSMAELRKEMSAGKISFTDVKQAMIDATTEGGRFYGMLDKQSQTLQGRLSTLSNTWQQIAKIIGDALLPAAKQTINVFSDWSEAILELANRLKILKSNIADLGLAELQQQLRMTWVRQEELTAAWRQWNAVLGNNIANKMWSQEIIAADEREKAIRKQIDALVEQQKANEAVENGFKDSSGAASDTSTAYEKFTQKVNKLKDALLIMSIRGQENTKAFAHGKETLTQYTLQIEKANKAVEVHTGAYDAFQAKVQQAQENLQNLAAADVVDIQKFRQAKQEATDLQIRLETINRAINIDTRPYDELNTKIGDLKRQLEDLAYTGATTGFTEELKTQIAAIKNEYVEAVITMEGINRVVSSSMGLTLKNVAKSIQSDLASALITPFREGETALERYGNLAISIISKIGQAMVEELLKQITLEETLLAIKTAGKVIGGFFGFADGAAFKNGKVIPFASGGVVSQPTAFPMSGGKTGVMGEAGAEAIMPLKRTSDGRLGVEATGTAPNINIYNQSQSQIETIKRPNGDVDLFIRRVNSALASERTNNGFARASQRQQPRGIQAV